MLTNIPHSKIIKALHDISQDSNFGFFIMHSSWQRGRQAKLSRHINHDRLSARSNSYSKLISETRIFRKFPCGYFLSLIVLNPVHTRAICLRQSPFVQLALRKNLPCARNFEKVFSTNEQNLTKP